MYTSSKILAVLISFSLALSPLPASAEQSGLSSTLKKMQDLYSSSKKYSSEVEYNAVFSPSFTRKEQKALLKETNRSFSFWHDEVNLGNIDILFWKAKDINWAKKKFEEMGKGWGANSKALDEDVQKNNGKLECVGSNLGVFHRNPTTNQLELNHQIRFCVDEEMDPWSWHVISHEVAHVWQFSTHPMETNMKHPWWLVEGGATFYGAALGATGQKGGARHIKKKYLSFLKYMPGSQSVVRKTILENPSYLYKYLTTNLNQHLNEKYFFGSVVVSEIVKKYGHDKFLEFYKSFNQNSDLEYNFKMIFSEDFETFCDRIVQDFLSHF
jgi:hypothetical protein